MLCSGRPKVPEGGRLMGLVDEKSINSLAPVAFPLSKKSGLMLYFMSQNTKTNTLLDFSPSFMLLDASL